MERWISENIPAIEEVSASERRFGKRRTTIPSGLPPLPGLERTQRKLPKLPGL